MQYFTTLLIVIKERHQHLSSKFCYLTIIAISWSLSRNVTLLTGGIELINWQVKLVIVPSALIVLPKRMTLVGTEIINY